MVLEFDGAWRVTVVREGASAQTFSCHDEAAARRLVSLFERPDRIIPAPAAEAAAQEETAPSVLDRVVPQVLAVASLLVAVMKAARPQRQRFVMPGRQMRFVVPELEGYSAL